MPEYFTLAELRALPDMDDDTRYTDDRCEAAAAYVVAIIERVVGTSFVPRDVTQVFDGHMASDDVVLSASYVRSVTSATVDGVSVSDDLRVAPGGVLRRFPVGTYVPDVWPTGNVTVEYTAGYSDTPPGDIKEAALQATRARLLTMDSQAGIDDRRTSMSTDQGTVNFVVAGEDRPTGYPEVDAVIVGWRDKLGGFGFA